MDLTAKDNKNSDNARLHLLRAVANNANDAILVTEAWPVEEPGPPVDFLKIDRSFVSCLQDEAED